MYDGWVGSTKGFLTKAVGRVNVSYKREERERESDVYKYLMSVPASCKYLHTT